MLENASFTFKTVLLFLGDAYKKWITKEENVQSLCRKSSQCSRYLCFIHLV